MIFGGLREKGIKKLSTSDKPLITVVTVVYNGGTTLEQTIQSVVNQTYKNVEYIIIDGASTDETLDIIKKYEDKIDYWQSESDKGIYDAMNKGICLATGEWINFMNSGDIFSSNRVLESVFSFNIEENVKIIYGDYEKKTSTGCIEKFYADENIDLLKKYPIYRHGASFVKTEYHKENLFKLDRKDLGFALDFLFIYDSYLNNVVFKYIHCCIMIYLEEGASSNIPKELMYNQRITGSSYIISLIKRFKYILLSNFLIHKMYTFITQFYQNILINGVINIIPFWFVRKFFYKIGHARIGKSTINMFQHIIEIKKFNVGNNTHINRYCLFDCRGGISIGDNVSISYGSKLITGSHNVDSETFLPEFAPIVIHDNVWIGAGSTILNDVVIHKGAVVCAGAVVTKDVPPFCIVAGIPARIIGNRNQKLEYNCSSPELFL